ncbi:hypothetical protein JTB14_022241 [Gonioctena quinquepunctata]|nr:hypothetical protein JTB14_022241 [Gonioctena quinquepunctata]
MGQNEPYHGGAKRSDRLSKISTAIPDHGAYLRGEKSGATKTGPLRVCDRLLRLGRKWYAATSGINHFNVPVEWRINGAVITFVKRTSITTQPLRSLGSLLLCSSMG